MKLHPLRQLYLWLPVAFCMLVVQGVSQPAVEWEANFSRSAYDRPYGTCINPMGEIVVCGATWNDSNQTYDGIVIKLDFQGNKIWQKIIGYGNSDLLTSIAVVPGGGYVAAGRTDSKGEGAHDFWIVRLDEKGNILWEKTYGGIYEDKAEDLLVAKDGSILLSGTRMTVSSSTIDLWILKLNAEGEKIWDKQLGGHFRSHGEALAELNGKYVVAGYFEPMGSEKYKEDMGLVLMLDGNGQLVWEKIFGGDQEDAFHDVKVTEKNEILVAGSTRSKGKGYEDIWVMKLTDKGDLIWEQTWGEIGKDEAKSMALVADGIVITGLSNSRETNSDDIQVLKYDWSGSLAWNIRLGKELNDRPYELLASGDGGFIIAAERCTHYNYDSKPVRCGMNMIKLMGTPSQSIENYVALKVRAWEKRGEFEKTESFQKRVSEENRKQIIAKHTREAVAYYAGQLIDLGKATLSDYDADKEEFQIVVKGIGPLRVRVPVDEAQSFKEGFSGVQFESPEYDLADGRFELSRCIMVVGPKEYLYISKRRAGDSDRISNIFVFNAERKLQDPNTYRGSADPLKGLNVSKPKTTIGAGKYYALIIGVDNYKGSWTPLQNAVRDAQAVELLLKGKYRFDHFKTLYDEQASRVNILNAMEWLVANTTDNDNVFIYFSGHGEFKKELNKGFWVPADAQTTSMAAYISNSDLQTFLGGIRSKHTLLVSDACFSGDIFRGNTVAVKMESTEKYYTETYNLRSRQAMTSGGVEPVMDGGKDGHSVFAYYFLQALRNHDGIYLDAAQLFEKLKIPVTNNSEQKPILQPVKNAGDEGGQFIFIRKGN